MATQQEVIRNFMAVLDVTNRKGYAALDEAVQKATPFASWQAVVDAMYADSKKYGADAFLKQRCGIILDNDDTGAITGSDAGGNTKTAESIVPELAAELKTPDAPSTTYSEYGVTVKWPDLATLTEKQRLIVSGLYTWWIPESLQLIKDSYGLSFDESGTTVKEISQIKFVNENSSTLATVWSTHLAGDSKTTRLQLDINMHHYNGIIDDVNGTADNATYMDRVIAHEMTHAVMAANINNFSNLPHHFTEGAAELIHGIDDERRDNIAYLAEDPDYMRKILLDNAKYVDGYSAGYMALRYLARQAAEDGSTPSVISVPTEPAYSPGGTSNPSQPSSPPVSAGPRKLSVQGGGRYWLGGYDPLEGEEVASYPDATELDASGSSDSVILGGNAKNNLIKAGSGQSSLWGGGSSSDTLQGGSARDMIWYGAGDGHDVVKSFAAGTGDNSDVLNLYSGSLAAVSRSGNTVSLSMSDGSSLQVGTNAGADGVILYSTDGGDNLFGAKIGESSKGSRLSYQEEVSFYQGGSGRDTLQAAGSGDKLIWLDGSRGAAYSGIEIIDGSASSGADQLAGSGAEELILGGGGEASLWGGAGSGNDTLQAGKGGNVVFYGYGEGSDVIKDTTDSDRVMLYNIGLGQVAAASVGASEVSVTTTAGQILKVYGTAGTFTLGDGSSWRPDRQNGSWQRV